MKAQVVESAPNMGITIGILDLQGCVAQHIPHLQALGAKVVRVRSTGELHQIDGLIIPGGESSTMLKLMEVFELELPLLEVAGKIPFWGICAGAILMCKEVLNPQQKSLNLINATLMRNAYGRQLDSFSLPIRNELVAFIRAPKITKLSSHLVVAESLNSEAVFVQDPVSSHQITTFHPELSPSVPSVFHKEFVDLCLRKKRERESFRSLESAPLNSTPN